MGLPFTLRVPSVKRDRRIPMKILIIMFSLIFALSAC
jgi:hypothetical protein